MIKQAYSAGVMAALDKFAVLITPPPGASSVFNGAKSTALALRPPTTIVHVPGHGTSTGLGHALWETAKQKWFPAAKPYLPYAGAAAGGYMLNSMLNSDRG